MAPMGVDDLADVVDAAGVLVLPDVDVFVLEPEADVLVELVDVPVLLLLLLVRVSGLREWSIA